MAALPAGILAVWAAPAAGDSLRLRPLGPLLTRRRLRALWCRQLRRFSLLRYGRCSFRRPGGGSGGVTSGVGHRRAAKCRCNAVAVLVVGVRGAVGMGVGTGVGVAAEPARSRDLMAERIIRDGQDCALRVAREVLGSMTTVPPRRRARATYNETTLGPSPAAHGSVALCPISMPTSRARWPHHDMNL